MAFIPIYKRMLQVAGHLKNTSTLDCAQLVSSGKISISANSKCRVGTDMGTDIGTAGVLSRYRHRYRHGTAGVLSRYRHRYSWGTIEVQT